MKRRTTTKLCFQCGGRTGKRAKRGLFFCSVRCAAEYAETDLGDRGNDWCDVCNEQGREAR